MLIQVGSTESMNGGSLSTIWDAILHPKYMETPRAADIAVTILNIPMTMSPTINIPHLPPQGSYIPDGSLMSVAIWGLGLVSMSIIFMIINFLQKAPYKFGLVKWWQHF